MLPGIISVFAGLSVLVFAASSFGVRWAASRRRLTRELEHKTSELKRANAELRGEVAERARIEAMLREREESLANAQRIGKMGNWDRDIANDAVIWSEQIYRIFGLEPRQFGPTYDDYLQYVHPDDRDKVQGAVEGALAGSGKFAIDYRTVLPGGQERFVHGQGEVIFDPSGQPLRMSGIIQDVTDQTLAERQIRESEARLRNILANVSGFVGIHSLDGVLIQASGTAAQANACDIGKFAWESEAWSHSPALQKKLREAIVAAAGGETVRFDAELRPSEGREITIDAIWAPLRDADGRIVAVIASAVDVTERKTAERALQVSERMLQERVQELEAAHRKLEQQGADLAATAEDLRIARDRAEAANRAKSQFLATMSHELRTPLNAIIGFSEMIQAQVFGPIGSPRYIDYVGDIAASGHHLLSLINDILDLSKVEDGAAELHEERIELPAVVESVMRLVRPRAADGKVELRTELVPDLPALLADERKLKQILVNLLSNAIKFTEAGGSVTARVSWENARHMLIEVADTGIGMSEDDIPKALSQFGQIDGELNRKYEGTGLGLPLTKALAELHGGSLEVTSEPGVGTTVSVFFPPHRIAAENPARSKVA